MFSFSKQTLPAASAKSNLGILPKGANTHTTREEEGEEEARKGSSSGGMADTRLPAKRLKNSNDDDSALGERIDFQYAYNRFKSALIASCSNRYLFANAVYLVSLCLFGFVCVCVCVV